MQRERPKGGQSLVIYDVGNGTQTAASLFVSIYCPSSSLALDQTGRWPPPLYPSLRPAPRHRAALTQLFAAALEDSQTRSADPSILHDVEPIRK